MGKNVIQLDRLQVIIKYSEGKMQFTCRISKARLPKFAGSNAAEAVEFLRCEKILSTPSFGGKVKPSVPFGRFAACKISLNITWKSTFRQNYRTFLAQRVPPFATRGLSRCVDVREHLVTEAGTSKLWGGGTQGCTISLLAAVHLRCMPRALLAKKKKARL